MYELNKRRQITDCFGTSPYGPLPSAKELGDLVNADDCAVCGIGGDLLCCDKCPASYHRACIDVPQFKDLGDGTWLCPECKTPDSAKLGPLHGGSKAAIEWFGLKDLGLKPEKGQSSRDPSRDVTAMTETATDNVNSEDVSKTSLHTCEKVKQPKRTKNEDSNIPSVDVDLPRDTGAGGRETPTSMLPTEEAHSAQHVFPASSSMTVHSVGSGELYDDQWTIKNGYNGKLDTMEFLVVHGFVFSRLKTSKGLFNVDAMHLRLQKSNLRMPLIQNRNVSHLGSNWRNQISPSPLEPAQLYEVLQMFGPDASSIWPLDHIQCPPAKVAASNGFAVEFCSPLAYVNRYRRAPAPALLPGLTDRTSEGAICELLPCPSLSFALVDRLVQEYSNDAILSSALREGYRLGDSVLCDPLKPFKDYAIRLERSLNRATLLREEWGTTDTELQEDVWARNVQRCRSIRRLAKLLVELIDSTHSRAFVQDWMLGPQGGRRDRKGPDTSAIKLTPLGSAWNPDDEIRRRRWERVSAGDVLSQLRSEGRGVGISNSGGRKKRRVACVREVFGEEVTQNQPIKSSSVELTPKKIKEDTTSIIGCSKRELSLSSATSLQDDPSSSVLSNKDTPKRNRSAYIHFNIHMRGEARKQGKNVSKMCDFNKHVGELWKKLGPDRSKWKEIARKDKLRYLAEVQAYTENQTSTEDVAGVFRSVGQRDFGKGIGNSGSSSQTATLVFSERSATTATVSVESNSCSADVERAQKMTELKHALLSAESDDEKESHWPVAGQTLFDPEARLSKYVVRWLGRTAGVMAAPFLTYSSGFEVGRPAQCHIWRKNMLDCRTVDEAALQVRTLESFLNKVVRKVVGLYNLPIVKLIAASSMLVIWIVATARCLHHGVWMCILTCCTSLYIFY